LLDELGLPCFARNDGGKFHPINNNERKIP